jgi:hypothetical protein
MARKPVGWNPSMLARKASTDSGGVASENTVGRRVATNSAGDSSASIIAWRSRCSVTSAGRDPAQPA